MQSTATTVDEYLASLPPDRRDAMIAVRRVILKNLDKDYAEGMQYGMIGYYVPHTVFPAGYHCDPRQPLSFAGLASQKGHMSLYLMCVYGSPEHRSWFNAAWAKSGKKLDMGKACVRFKKVEDLALDVVGEAIRRVPAKKYVKAYLEILGESKEDRAKRREAMASKTPASKEPATKKPVSKKPASKKPAATKPGTRTPAGRGAKKG